MAVEKQLDVAQIKLSAGAQDQHNAVMVMSEECMSNEDILALMHINTFSWICAFCLFRAYSTLSGYADNELTSALNCYE